MTPAARSVQVFGWYIVVLGLTLLVVPNTLLVLFRFEPTVEPWIRVVGTLLLPLAAIYLVAARHEATAIFRVTVWNRCWILVAFTAFWLLEIAKPELILFALVDVAGAAWTWSALRRRADSGVP